MTESYQIKHFLIRHLPCQKNCIPVFFTEVISWHDRLVLFPKHLGELRITLETYAKRLRILSNNRNNLTIWLVSVFIYRRSLTKWIIKPHLRQAKQKLFNIFMCHTLTFPK